MACGTGKTLVGLWMCESSGSIRTLVLIPSLSLIKQIYRKWYDSSIEPFQALSVCSDQSTKDHRFPSDTIVVAGLWAPQVRASHTEGRCEQEHLLDSAITIGETV